MTRHLLILLLLACLAAAGCKTHSGWGIGDLSQAKRFYANSANDRELSTGTSNNAAFVSWKNPGFPILEYMR